MLPSTTFIGSLGSSEITLVSSAFQQLKGFSTLTDEYEQLSGSPGEAVLDGATLTITLPGFTGPLSSALVYSIQLVPKVGGVDFQSLLMLLVFDSFLF